MLEFSIATASIFIGVLNEIVKTISKKCFNYDIKKYIPIFSIGFGIILGVCGYFTPNIDFGRNLLEAIFIGIASGGNAVGFHQIYKQLSKRNEVDDNVDYVQEEDLVDEEAEQTTPEEDVVEETEEESTNETSTEDVDDYSENE